MYRMPDEQPRHSHGVYRNWTIKLFALPLLLVVALIGFAVSHPEVPRWISAAAQAEFAGSEAVPGATSVRLTGKIRSVKVH
jgi:cell division protein FtsW (lipid II flippase)